MATMARAVRDMAIGIQALGFFRVERSALMLCIVKYFGIQTQAGSRPLQPVHEKVVDVVRVGIGRALAGVVGGKLTSVVVPVGKEVVEDVPHAGVVPLAARAPEGNVVLQA